VIAYLDSSVLLRVLLRSPNALAEWGQVETGIASVLMRVESCRTLDRLLHDHQITENEYQLKMHELADMLARVLLIPITDDIVQRASARLPVRLATLDAIHLATASAYRERQPPGQTLHFATHDLALATAARAARLSVIGV
jgi:predicted nucleic acid-binding protein